MEYITFISEDLMYALGWTVVHSLWQALLIAILMGVLMIRLKKQSAQARYIVFNTGLLAVLVLSIITFWDLYSFGHASTVQQFTAGTDTTILFAAEDYKLSESIFQPIIQFFNEKLSLIVLLWLVGVGFFVLRLVGGVAFVHYLRRYQLYPVTYDLQEKLQRLMEQIPLHKTIALAESALVKVPMVIGHFKPVILLPIGAINQLSTKEVEAILAHELAHIARNDYLLNILQSVIEVLFYYNPAVWWISANIRVERENCCDDIAIDLCGNSLTYAKALVSLQEIAYTAPSLAMSFARNKGQLLNRVRRILNQPQNRSNIMEKLIATCLLVLTISFFSINAHSSDNFEEAILPILELNEFDNPTEHTLPNLAVLDTVPKTKKRERIRQRENDENIEIILEADEITHLEINGREIPEEEWSNYKDKIEDVRKSAPITPPTPPTPPSSSSIPKPPVPPVPPTPSGLNDLGKSEFTIKQIITTEDDDEGAKIVTIEKNGTKNTIVIAGDEDYEVKVDGKMITIGDTLIILDDINVMSNIDFVEDINAWIPKLGDHQEEIHAALERYDLHAFDEETQEAFEAEQESYEEEMVILNQELHAYQSAMSEQIEEAVHSFERAREQVQKDKSLSAEELKEQIEEAHEDLEEVIKEYSKEMTSFSNEFHSQQDEIIEDWQSHLEEFHELKAHQHKEKNELNIIGKELYEDGIIKNPKHYRLVLSAKKMKVNRKKQSADVKGKYLSLYKNLFGTDLDSGKDIEIEINIF